ncbi:MAG: FecR domain-containing protein [Elusimicrobiota bacterium]
MRYTGKVVVLILLLDLITLLPFDVLYSSEVTGFTGATLMDTQGAVRVFHSAESEGVAAAKDMILDEGDIVRTEDNGKADILFYDGTLVELENSTRVIIKKANYAPEQNRLDIEVVTGKVLVNVERLEKAPRTNAVVYTPAAVMNLQEAHAVIIVEKGNSTVIGLFYGEAEIRSVVSTGKTKKMHPIRVFTNYQATVFAGKQPEAPVGLMPYLKVYKQQIGVFQQFAQSNRKMLRSIIEKRKKTDAEYIEYKAKQQQDRLSKEIPVKKDKNNKRR